MTIYPPMAFLLSVRLQTGNVSDTWDMRHDELNHILRSTSFKRKGTQNIQQFTKVEKHRRRNKTEQARKQVESYRSDWK